MTMFRMYGSQMSCGASAPCANADFSCAHTASMQSANPIALILDAMMMASIIIFSLVVRLSILRVSLVLLVLVLLVALLVYEKANTPRTGMFV